MRTLAFVVVFAGLVGTGPRASSPRFYPDDPLMHEPATQDASGVAPWDIDLAWDMVENLFSRPGDGPDGTRAVNVNTIDEVPDGAWFTNRAGARPLAPEDVARGSDTGTGPAAGRWTVVAAKTDGISPGFTVRDRNGDLWFLKFDPRGWRGMATGTEVVVTKLLWALGYHTPENHIAALRADELEIAEGTTITPPGGRQRAMKTGDIQWLLQQADREPDGSYRVIASRALAGRVLGGFRFHGTRPDDPNDVFPHEHRRELRGYGVFSAWLNHVDAKSINTLDTLVDVGGRRIVRHHLLDFGSTLGSAAIAPREWWEGREYLIEPGQVGMQILGFGFHGIGDRMFPVYEAPAVGRLDVDPDWDPDTWRPRIPNPAFLRARADDRFWAARRVVALTDEILRAAAATGRFGDEDSESALVRYLAQRRDAIGRKYLNGTNPVVDFALDGSGTMTFRNEAVDRAFAAPADSYRIVWARFDNATGEASAAGEMSVTGTRAAMPGALMAADYVRAVVTSHHPQRPDWLHPVHVFFRKEPGGWKTVGLERIVR